MQHDAVGMLKYFAILKTSKVIVFFDKNNIFFVIVVFVYAGTTSIFVYTGILHGYWTYPIYY